MRHGRRRRRLGMVGERRRALLRGLARNFIVRQQIVTTHARAKETSRFVDQLITIAKQKSLHSRRQLVRKLGSGSERLAKHMEETVAPKFSERKGGYTRVLHYKTRSGDAAGLSLLEFTVPVIKEKQKKPKKKKEKKPSTKDKVKGEAEKTEQRASETGKEETTKEETTKKETQKKETQKKGGFLSSLRKFLKGDEDKK
jgi:large subunit ribosomal protein L17